MTATISDPIEIVTSVRAALRRATKTHGDPLHGLTVSVRQEHRSMLHTIYLLITGLTFPLRGEPSQEWPSGPWTPQAHELAARTRELAADLLAWEAGNPDMRSVTILFDGRSGPGPLAADQAAYFDAVDELHAEQEPVVATIHPFPQRPVLHVISDDEARVLEALAGTLGARAQAVARLVVDAATTTDTLADSASVGATFRAVYAALGLDLP